jgi:hypothetical protein
MKSPSAVARRTAIFRTPATTVSSGASMPRSPLGLEAEQRADPAQREQVLVAGHERHRRIR